MSFFTLSDGTNAVADASAEYELPGGNLEPIPEGSSVLAIIDEAKWLGDDSGRYCISLRWSVLQPDTFKNRKVFQKLWVDDSDPREADPVKAGRKKDRAKKMLLAIDFNAGRGLSRLAGKPTDDDLMANLCNKPMVIRLGVWAMIGSQGDDMNGNWVQAVAASTKPVNITTAPMPKARAAPGGSVPSGSASDFASMSFEDDIPF